jgi:thiamine biosynthesis protein ThiI
MTKVLVRYGELGLKSERVMRRFLKRLTEEMSDRLAEAGIDHILESERGRIFVESNDPKGAISVLKHVSGVFSLSEVVECRSGYEDLMACLREFGKVHIGPGMSYGLKVKRIGTQAYTSMDIAMNGGGAVVSHLKDGEARVDLGSPDILVEVEVRENKAYIFTERVRGVGGMPAGTQGRVLLYLPPDPDPETVKRAALSYWMLSRRGSRVVPALVTGADSTWKDGMRAHSIDVEPLHLDISDIAGSLARACRETHAAGIAYPYDAGTHPPDPALHPRSDPIAEFYPTAGIGPSDLERYLDRFM